MRVWLDPNRLASRQLTATDVVRAIREAVPDIHVHAFSALEVWQGAATLDLSLEERLKLLRYVVRHITNLPHHDRQTEFSIREGRLIVQVTAALLSHALSDDAR